MLRHDCIEGALLADRPALHAVVSNLCQQQLLNQIHQELMQIQFNGVDTDHIATNVTKDLAKRRAKEIGKKVYEFIQKVIYGTEMLEFVETTFGASVKQDVKSCFGCIYQKGQYRICDYQPSEYRRIYFEFSLIDEKWQENDGGCVLLYGSDPVNEPARILPRRNSILLYDNCWHAMSETLSKEFLRVSFNGYYELNQQALSIPIPKRVLTQHVSSVEGNSDLVNEWVSRSYRRKKFVKKVKKQFCSDSSVELHNFLQKDKCNDLCKALSQTEKWTLVGQNPAQSSYSTLTIDEKTEGIGCTEDFLAMIHSDLFRSMLETFTTIKLASMKSVEIRQFGPGCYDLRRTQEAKELDVIFCVSDQEWKEEWNGDIVYVDIETDEELVILPPTPGSVSLVYRAEEGLDRCTKYVSLNAMTPKYEIALTFTVQNE